MAKKNFISHLRAASQGQRETETFVKENIQIDEELKSLIPPLLPEERAQLEANLRQEGIREPVIVWKGENLLLDGHNRYEIARAHNLDFRVTLREFSDREAAKSWMINNQLGRRNLTPEQQSYLRGKRYEAEKQRHGGDRKSSSQNANLKTSDALAAAYSVSKDTIIRDARFARGLDLIGSSNPSLKARILAGGEKVKKSAVQQLAKAAEKYPETSWQFTSAEDISRILAGLKSGGKAKSVVKKTTAKNVEMTESLEQAVEELQKNVADFAAKPGPGRLAKLKKLVTKLEEILSR